MLTSQFPSFNMYYMLGGSTIADANLECIIHTDHTIELCGESRKIDKIKRVK